MKTLSIIFLLPVLLWSCQNNDGPVPEPHVNSQRVSIPVRIGGDVAFSESDLSGRVSLSEPIYFFIGVFEVEGEEYSTDPHNRELLYACGGFNSIPEDLELSLFPNQNYTIQSLAIKKSNGFGFVKDDYEYNGTTFKRLKFGWEGNPQIPAVLSDSICYSDRWLYEGYNGLLSFNEGGYQTLEEYDSLSIFTFPQVANTFYQSMRIKTTPDLEVIEIKPKRNVFGIEVQATGLTETNYLELKAGYAQTFPIPITTSKNNETFVYVGLGVTKVSYPLTITQVSINSFGERLKNTLYKTDQYDFPIGKKTLIQVKLESKESGRNGASIELIDIPLTNADTLKFGF